MKRSSLIWIGAVALLATVAALVFFNRGIQDGVLSIEDSIRLTVALANTQQAALQSSDTPPPTTATDLAPTKTSLPSPTANIVEEHPEQIAFASDRTGRAQIWIINIDGSEERQLTDLVGGACQPSWSPEATYIAFTSPCLANRSSYPGSAIYLYVLESGNVTQLTEGDSGDYDPAWSPDGRLIAFTSLRLSRSQLFLYDMDTQEVRLISSISLYEYQPSWSADGKKLAFISTANGPELIFTGAPEAGNRSQFLSVEDSEEKFVSSPRWAVNGKGIYYTRSPRSGGFAEIFYAPSPGNPTQHQPLFDEVIPGRDSSLSPDGNWIAFEGWPNTSNHDIWIASSSGENRIRLTTDSANDFDPAWRP